MIDKVILEGEEILIGTINHKERLTKEQLLLGATETFMLNEDNYVSLWCQNPEIDLYSIAGHYQGDFFWIQYTYLTHARKLYKKVLNLRAVCYCMFSSPEDFFKHLEVNCIADEDWVISDETNIELEPFENLYTTIL